MNSALASTTGFLYKNLVKKIFFLKSPETVHRRLVSLGNRLGESSFIKRLTSSVFTVKDNALSQSLFGLTFENPIGLAAGFDYEAKLTQILPSLGFGFGTVGTLTFLPYGGNPSPMLGRLIKSKSLMVNKGFKNLGIAQTLKTLEGKSFTYPVGVSIGKTNTPTYKTQAEGVHDIVQGFTIAEASGVPFAYYELNISCPNLAGNIEFYEPRHLSELLDALSVLKLSKPVFIKMPIAKTDAQISAMLDVITRYKFIQAVIIGNLQRDRQDPAFVKDEVSRWNVGNFSGLPCQKRSEELIRLVYKNYGSKIKVIGCGGTFSGEDAYRKIKLGASLVQLITGMIFEGPQLISQINRDLSVLLRRDGFTSITQAIGCEAEK